MGRINHDRKSRLAAFDRLIASVRACCRVNPDVEARMEKI
jgi:diaminopimelate decarboxylase